MYNIVKLYIGSMSEIIPIIDSILKQELFQGVIDKANRIISIKNIFPSFRILCQKKLNNMYELNQLCRNTDIIVKRKLTIIDI